MARTASGRKPVARKSSVGRPAAKKTAPKPASRGKAPPAKPARAKAAVGKTAARNAPKKATRVATARKPAPKPAARRMASAKRVAPAAAARLAAKNGPQRFTVSHLNEADFKADGLRAYAKYRDLGIAAATGGLCQAHVIRLTPPCTDDVRKRHTHETELQLVYVLKGWMKNEFEGHGEQMMSQGSCWLQPPGIRHTVLDYSADCEVLEIIVPADFTTAEVP